MTPFSLGTHVASRYILQECVGIGGMGWVFRAIDTALDDHVIALKVFYPHLVRSIDTQQFEVEALTSRRLSHPNIVQVYNYHRLSDDTAIMTMEFVQGATLRDHILSPQDGREIPIIDCIVEVVDGLAYAHRSGVLHRDIKAENILITETHSCKIADFGIAQLLAEAGSEHSQKFAGTPAYMSPEQFSGELLTPASDVYSFGILLYFILHRQTPFTAKTVFEMAEQHSQCPLPSNREILKQYPQWVAQLLQNCCAKKAGERFQSMDEVATFIEETHGHRFSREETASELSFSQPPQSSDTFSHVDEQARPALRGLLYLHAIAALGTGFTSLFSSDIGYRVAFVVVSFHALGLLCRTWLRWTATALAFAGSLSALAYLNPWSREQVVVGLLHLEARTGIEIGGVKRMLGFPLSVERPELLFDLKVNSELLKIILASPIDMSVQSSRGENLLHRLSGSLPDWVAASLRDVGLDLNARDMHGRTPLYRAVDDGEDWPVDFLLFSGADVNLPDSEGRTPLSIAIERESLRNIQRLSCYGARADLRSYYEANLSIFERALQRQDPLPIACLLLNEISSEHSQLERWHAFAKAIKPRGRHYSLNLKLLQSAQKHAGGGGVSAFRAETAADVFVDGCDCEPLLKSHEVGHARIEQQRAGRQ